jgi:O-antigen ligase
MRLIRLYNLSFILFASFPLFNIRISNFIAIFWCLISVIILIKHKTYKRINKKEILIILILSLYYIFLIINYFLSGFDKAIFKFLETDILMLLFPFLIILNKNFIISEVLKNSLITFFISNVLLSLICWFKILKTGYFLLLEQDNYYQPVFRNLFSDTTRIHLPNLGLFFAFSIFIGFFLIIKYNHKFYIKILLLLSCFLLLFSIVTFSARMSLLTVVLIFIYLIYSRIKSKVARLLLSIIILSASVILILNAPIKKRFIEVMNTKLELPSEKLNNKSHLVNFRYGIYYCGYNIMKESFLFGIGKENISKQMNNCYKSFTYSNFDDFEKKDYNTHNQYLDTIISFGVFGFIILFVSLFFGFYQNINELYKVFLFIIFMALLTENLFERQIGVMLYAFFNSFFYLYKTQK